MVVFCEAADVHENLEEKLGLTLDDATYLARITSAIKTASGYIDLCIPKAPTDEDMLERLKEVCKLRAAAEVLRAYYKEGQSDDIPKSWEKLAKEILDKYLQKIDAANPDDNVPDIALVGITVYESD
ncbi:hypothetical protein HNP93_000998 [Methanococcus maripaludis]|uniref:Uncharacterized protein n=1 Tax=Methanococcus maripaludis TaxID=39152 RepID=A0A7J9P6E8_METMI|nr:hypothetical protein [Methanococcus maripaludis]MBA2858297.1 hypothetical protein [Methanococcus maripaludis]